MVEKPKNRENGIEWREVEAHWGRKPKRPQSEDRGLLNLSRRRPTFPRSYPRSIIGPARLNFRVRDGNGCDPRGITTGNFLRAGGKRRKLKPPCSKPAGAPEKLRAWQQKLAGITSSTRIEQTAEAKLASRCFLKDGLRKFYD